MKKIVIMALMLVSVSLFARECTTCQICSVMKNGNIADTDTVKVVDQIVDTCNSLTGDIFTQVLCNMFVVGEDGKIKVETDGSINIQRDELVSAQSICDGLAKLNTTSTEDDEPWYETFFKTLAYYQFYSKVGSVYLPHGPVR